jgi:hypothetical protein
MKVTQGNSLESYLKQTKMFFVFQKQKTEGKTGFMWGLVLVGGRRI